MSKKLLLSVVSVLMLAVIFLSSCSKKPDDVKAEGNSTTKYSEENTDLQETVTGDEAGDTHLGEEVAATDLGKETTKKQNGKTDKETEKESQKPSNNKAEDKKTWSDAEIVAYYNECANKVKTEASEVVKNHEKRSVGELKVPSALQSISEDILKSTIKDDTDAIVYTGKEEIRENFIVPAQIYVSRLTVNDIEKATCKDNGKTYDIYFKLKNEKNPVSGKGVGSAFDVIEAHDVAAKAPSFVKELSTYYYNCEIKATIDKQTGRLIHAVYSTPVRLSVIVELFGTHDIMANFTYVKDYTITY